MKTKKLWDKWNMENIIEVYAIDRKTDTEERIINDSRLQTPIPSNSNFHVSFYNSQ